MTIIEPNKNKFRINLIAVFLAVLILTEAFLSIFVYNQSVRLEYLFSVRQKELEELRVANADFKNKLYGILDFQNADQMAGVLGLIKDKKPDYLAKQ